MIATLLEVGLTWLGMSVVVMIVLTVLVFAGGSRRGNREITSPIFDDAALVPIRGNAMNGATPKAARVAKPAGAEPAITHQVSEDSGSLNRLLAGVQLPCGLERLHLDDEDETMSMAFVTAEAEPRIIAVSLVDELERLGMEVEPLSYTEARAHRDGFELAVTIYLEPRRVIRDRRTAFPKAPTDSVVVEFTMV